LELEAFGGGGEREEEEEEEEEVAAAAAVVPLPSVSLTGRARSLASSGTRTLRRRAATLVAA